MKEEGGRLSRHLEAVEQKARIEALKAKLLAIEPGMVYHNSDLPPELEEAFLARVLAVEQAEETSYFDVLLENGITLPEPASLTDSEIDDLLHTIFTFLGARNVYFLHTDHLSDRELYDYLWSDVLREPTMDMPMGPGSLFCFDLTSSGSEQDTQIHLAYYADDCERESHALEWPEDPIPEKKALPFDRDRHLP
ncbi:MAG: hypothetical protein KDC71_09650, partial [Acidobacteria bacterium]|nr:hypothetical protein [Acidobacteriota bacterium]